MSERDISVEKISLVQLPQYREFIAKAGPKNFSYFPEAGGPALTDLFLSEIEEIKNFAPGIFIAKSGNNPVALLTAHNLEFDTNHFQMPMARIRHILGGVDPVLDLPAKKMLIAAGAGELRKAGVRHITVRLPADDIVSIYALEQAGFYLVDTIVEYYFDFRNSKIPKTDSSCELRLYRPGDRAMVEKSTRDIFSNYPGRFHNDPNLDKAKADQLYANWLVNSCQGLSDDCILALVGGELAGITTLKIHRGLDKYIPFRIGEVVLTGTVPGFRGKKVYTSMLNFAQNYFAAKIDLFKYATQLNNFYVQRALVRLGFFLKYAYHTFGYYYPGG
jgi:hypothetical protein